MSGVLRIVTLALICCTCSCFAQQSLFKAGPLLGFNSSQLEGDEASEQSISLMESMVYKMNFSFAKPVKVVYSSADTEMGGKKNRQVMLETTFKTLMDDVSALNTSIVLK